ncbi:DinB family protein [soil metagenome]
MNNTAENIALQVITQAELLQHWQGHRNLTRRVIEKFPENEFFTYSIGGMRTFAELTMEMMGIAGPGIKGFVTGKWEALSEHFDHGHKKENILKKWDETTAEINNYWEQIPLEKFHETVTVFGQYTGTVYSHILYYIDNEIHHRGQGYVYLRSLNIEPPYFWER